MAQERSQPSRWASIQCGKGSDTGYSRGSLRLAHVHSRRGGRWALTEPTKGVLAALSADQRDRHQIRREQNCVRTPLRREGPPAGARLQPPAPSRLAGLGGLHKWVHGLSGARSPMAITGLMINSIGTDQLATSWALAAPVVAASRQSTWERPQARAGGSLPMPPMGLTFRTS